MNNSTGILTIPSAYSEESLVHIKCFVKRESNQFSKRIKKLLVLNIGLEENDEVMVIDANETDYITTKLWKNLIPNCSINVRVI